MIRCLRNIVVVSVSLVLGAASSLAQTQTANLHPGLVWKRISPTSSKLDGPVLYQIQLTLGTPNAVPKYDASGRHFTGSLITDNGSMVVIGGMSVAGGTGIISFANGQTFPGTGGVNTVTAGNPFITIGGTAANPTVGLNTTGIGATDTRYLQLGGGTMTGNITFASGQVFSGTTGVNSVTAGNSFIAIGGTPLNPTVGVNATANNTASTVVARDASGNFSAGSITLTGGIALPNTASPSVGVLALGGIPFVHNFGFNNTFVGAGAGNTTLTGTNNVAVGSSALTAIVNGVNNSALGSAALSNNTTGAFNAAFGYQA